MNRLVIVSAVLAAAIPMGAQTQRRASIVSGGGGDRGKCTAEVVVDGAADVEIRGDTGSLRTISGQPAQWRRLECTGPIPQNPVDFRFAGVDGRGRQQLVRDPRNGGAAVVHIEDSSGGAEGYTFDLFWGAGNNSGGNFPGRNNDGVGNYPGRNDGPGYGGRNNGPGGGADRGIGLSHRFTTEQAVEGCQASVRREAEQQFRARDVVFFDTRLDDNPGRRDWVVGRIEVRQGFNRTEPHRFACSVDFDNGVVRNVEIDPMRGGVGNFGGGPNARVRALETCQAAVEQRIRRDGYRNVDIGSIRMDDQPGRNDWVVGNARAERGPNFASYNFSCSVDLRSGDVRTVNVRRR